MPHCRIASHAATVFGIEHRGPPNRHQGSLQALHPSLRSGGGCPGGGTVIDVTGCQSIRQPASPHLLLPASGNRGCTFKH